MKATLFALSAGAVGLGLLLSCGSRSRLLGLQGEQATGSNTTQNGAQGSNGGPNRGSTASTALAGNAASSSATTATVNFGLTSAASATGASSNAGSFGGTAITSTGSGGVSGATITDGAGGQGGAGDDSGVTAYIYAGRVVLQLPFGYSELSTLGGLEFAFDIDQDSDSGWYAAFERFVHLQPNPLRLFVALDPYHMAQLAPCSFVQHNDTQLQISVPLAWLFSSSAPSITVRNAGRSVELAELVPEAAMPPTLTDAEPLCSKPQFQVVSDGSYTNLASAVGLVASTRGCALDIAGEARCWGYRERELSEPPPGPLSQLGFGNHQACALHPGGSVACWPSSDFSQGGVAPGETLSAIGENGPCGIQAETGALVRWSEDSASSILSTGPFIDVSCSLQVGCGILESGALECWGYGDDFGPASEIQWLNDSYVEVHTTPTTVCARTAQGQVQCALPEDPEVLELPGSDYQKLTGGYSQCALDSEGIPSCITAHPNIPMLPFLAIATGEYVYPHCGVLTDGRLICWGDVGGYTFP